MNINCDPTKLANDVIFSKKTQKENYPNLFLNQSPVIRDESKRFQFFATP